jgi:ELWxxDGT repeat protein
VYFNADDNQVGAELWRTDGTPAGTELVADIRPGPGAARSVPERFTVSGGRLLFTANDGVSGQELWVIDPGGTAERVGLPCGSGADLTATDPVLGAVMVVSGSRAPSSAIGFVLIGLPQAPLAITSVPCFLYLQPPSFAVLSSFSTAGATWSLPVPIPNAGSLQGLSFALQAVLAPTTSASGFDTTNGVFATLGY